MRLLFAKHTLAFPRSSGHDLRTYNLARACAALGHDVALATVDEPSPAALEGLDLRARYSLGGAPASSMNGVHATFLQRKFRSFWGVEDSHVAGLRAAVASFQPAAVVVAGLDALPYFPALDGVVRVWYAADEWAFHHASLLRPTLASVREHGWAGTVKGLYERAHRRAVDRVWVVSDADRRAMRWIAGMRAVDVLPNGVDSDYFQPGAEIPEPRTAVFWGRMDFGPNIDAVRWFCRDVWPLVRREVPDARVTFIGFYPTDEVRELTQTAGVTLEADVRDLRALVRRHAVAVMPLVSGAGIKNKLLEAAALGLPILCTPMSTRGLRGGAPVIAEETPAGFASALVRLWNDDARQRELGAACRTWVMKSHVWTATARDAVATIERTIHGERG